MTGYIRTDAQRQFAQNIAAISGDFHTHRLYPAFYDTFGRMIDGFIGNYEICIQMATSLTDWEIANGGAMAYEDLGSLSLTDAVYVDMAGNSDVRSAVHERYGQRLAHSAVVGATHHDRMGEVPDALPGPRPEFFFAPDRVAKRAQDWGRDGLERRLADAWAPYVEWTGGWLEVIHGHGPKDLEQAYLDLLDGHIDPAKAHVLSLQATAV